VGYDVAAKDSEVLDTDDATDVASISFLDVGEDGYLHVGLLHDLCRPLHDLHRHLLARLVVPHPQHLPEGALVDRLQDLVAVGQVVAQLVLVELAKLSDSYSASRLRAELLPDTTPSLSSPFRSLALSTCRALLSLIFPRK
jgi:hypothetical protein